MKKPKDQTQKSNAGFSAATVTEIAVLAQIPLTEAEKAGLAKGFNTTISVVDELNEVEVGGVEPTHQVTGLSNITRRDEVDQERMFTQEQALSNSPGTYNGYFMVPRLIDQDDH